MEKIKNLGYSIKLDTNGSRPKMLEEVVKSGFCDYIAMDIKNSPSKYGETIGVPGFDVSVIYESIKISFRHVLSGNGVLHRETGGA